MFPLPKKPMFAKGQDDDEDMMDLHGHGDGMDDEAKAKDEILAELIDALQGPLADKLTSKKPAAMEIAIMAGKGKMPKDGMDPDKDDDEDYC